jgi:DNA-binding NarL/FixJ family response regulator
MHVAVLEPREVLRVGLGVMVERIVRVERVDSYRDVDELVDRTTRDDSASPDIVIVSDAVTEVLRKHCPDTRVLEIIDSLEPTHLAIAATTEADGYLVLPEITESMLDGTLQALMRGELPIARPVASYLRDRARSADIEAEVARPRIQIHFSPRERDVIDLLLDGRSNTQIAQQLGISVHSAKRHVSAVLHKVNSPSRGHFIAWMLRES